MFTTSFGKISYRIVAAVCIIGILAIFSLYSFSLKNKNTSNTSSPALTKNVNRSGWQVFNKSTNFFSFEYPKSWGVVSFDGKNLINGIFVSPMVIGGEGLTEVEKDKYLLSISYLIGGPDSRPLVPSDFAKKVRFAIAEKTPFSICTTEESRSYAANNCSTDIALNNVNNSTFLDANVIRAYVNGLPANTWVIYGLSDTWLRFYEIGSKKRQVTQAVVFVLPSKDATLDVDQLGVLKSIRD